MFIRNVYILVSGTYFLNKIKYRLKNKGNSSEMNQKIIEKYFNE